jgi:DNA-binding SARP family transcriptional activator
MEGLFDGRSDESAKSYLRQTINRLREAFPEHSVVDTDRTHVHWIGGYLSSESVEFEHAVRQSMRLQGTARFDAATRALTIVDNGDYLDGFDSTFTVNRRQDLREMATDTRYDAAATAFSLGNLESAANYVRDVLIDDPYRESTWRLSMKVAAAMGHDDRVISAFRRCQDTLAELQTSPAQSTRRLLEQLRR